MDVKSINSVVVAKNPNITRVRSTHQRSKVPKKTRTTSPLSTGIDKAVLKATLDKIIRNTRFQYEIKDKLGYFVVRVIDRDTDKVIREIPSKEIQTVREHIEQVMGILFDKKI